MAGRAGHARPGWRKSVRPVAGIRLDGHTALSGTEWVDGWVCVVCCWLWHRPAGTRFLGASGHSRSDAKKKPPKILSCCVRSGRVGSQEGKPPESLAPAVVEARYT